MKKNFNEKRQRFSLRKLSIGLVSATVASLFFMSSFVGASEVSAQSIQYTYVTEEELTSSEKASIIYEQPGIVEKTDATYYLVYRPQLQDLHIPLVESEEKQSPLNQTLLNSTISETAENSQNSPHTLPKTGVIENILLGMTGIFTLVLAVKVSKKGKKELAGVILLTATGASFLAPTSHAISSQILAKFNHAIEVSEGQTLPAPNEIEGYVYIGYIKESKEAVDNSEETPVITEKPDTAPSKELPEAAMTEEIVSETKDIPFEKVTVYSSALLVGEQKVTQVGQVGKQVVESKQIYVNGQLVKTEKLSAKVLSEPVEEVLMIGTKDSSMNLSNSIDKLELPIETKNISKTEDIPFETHEIENASLAEGETRVAQEGANGVRTITIQQTIVDGQVLKEEEISSEITQAAIPKVVEIGTKKTEETIVTEVPDTAPSHQVPSIEISEEITSHVESIPFETQEVYDANLAAGVRQTVQVGQAGQRVIESKQTFAGGILLKSEIISESLQAAIPQIVHIGTKPVSPMPEPESVPQPEPVPQPTPDPGPEPETPVENTDEIVTEVPDTAPTYEVPAIQLTEEIVSNVETIPFPTQEITDPNLPEGTRQVVQVGQVGTRTIDTKLTFADGILISSEILSDVTSQPTAEIIAVGTKKQELDKLTTEVEQTVVDIAFETEYVDDPNLPLGQEQLQSQGVPGQKTITTTYTLINGVRQPNPTVSELITKQPIAQKIARGTKVIEEKTETETTTVELAFDTVVRESDSLYLGEESIQVEGKTGSKEITTTYKVIDGVRQPNPTVTEKILTAPVAKQVLKGTKPVEATDVEKRTEEIAFATQETPSADLYVGEEKVVTEGKVGTKEITTTYQTLKGVRQPNPTVTEKVLIAPVAKQVLKGTKPVEGTDVEKHTEEIAFATQETPSADLYVGEEKLVTEGKVGTKEITTTYQTLKGVRQPNPTVTEKVLTEPVSKQVLKGTKPVEGTDVEKRTEAIAYATQETPSADLYAGEERILVAGKVGTKEVTTTYQTIKGVRQPNPTVTEKVLTAPVAKQVLKGTKPVDGTDVEKHTEEIAYATQETPSAELYVGEEKVVTEGKVGTKEITTTYQTLKGVRQPNPTVTEKVLTEPVSKQVLKGTKPVEGTDVEKHTEEIAFATQETPSSDLYVGEEKVVTEGKVGTKEITTTYQTLKGVRQPNPTVTEKVLTEPITKQVLKGTKPVEGTDVEKRTEEITFATQEIASSDLYVGEEKVVTEGKVGTKEITTTYQTLKGVRQPNPTVTEKVLTEPVTKQVLKGTKPVEGTDVIVRKVTIPYETKRTDTDELYLGDFKVVVQGKVGTKEVTTTYQTIKGVRQPNPTITEQVLVEPVAREILRGTKPVTAIEKDVKTEVLPFETIYIDDPTMLEGKTKVEKEGKDGLKTITTVYQTIRGVRQNPPLSIEELIDHPENKVIRRGTKVEQIPTVTIAQLNKDEDKKSATATCSLNNPTDNYLRAVALLYKGEELVQEKEITDANGSMEFTNLDFYTDYTLKTKVFYTLDSVEHNAIQESLREFDLVYKKIEIKDIDAVTVYRRKNGEYTSAHFLDETPTNPDDLFVKVTSDRFKDMYLPISSIKETTKDGQAVYELTSNFDQLVEDKGNGFVQNRTFYIPKITKQAGIYTDFTSLLTAMQADPTGTFTLGANLYADEVQVGDVKAYMTDTFRGQLIGESNGKKYAIHNLKAPLFNKIDGATISAVDLKNVQISSALHRDLGSLANETAYSTISDVAVEGNLRAQRNLGGIVYKLDYQSRLSNASFQGRLDSYGRGESYVGGIVGMNPGSYISNVKADVAITILGENNQAAGAIAGRVTGWQSGNETNLKNAFATGSVTNLGTSQKVGGMVGTNDKGWNYGSFDNLVSQVQVTGGHPVIGQVFDAATKLTNAYSTTASDLSQQISEQEANSKLASMQITATTADSNTKDLNAYSVNYMALTDAQSDHATAYFNMEKLLPFYNKELIVYYGNKISSTDKLNQVKLIDVVPMKGDAIVADMVADKAAINKIMLYFEDGTVDYKSVAYAEDFKNNHILEYDISSMHIPYTPESFVNQNDAMVNRLVDLLSPIAYESEALLKQLNPPAQAAEQTTNDINDMYFKSSFTRIKDNLASYLRKVLTATMNGQGQSVETYFESKIAENKEAFLLGLSYLDRWYDINYDQLNTKELTLFNMDFFGNHSASTLDAIISIGKAGHAALRPKNNVELYSSYLAEMTGKSTVFDLVESYRKVFTPNKTDNQWFKDNTKAYIVEMKSQVEEALEKQNTATKHSKYAVEVYDKITNPTWRYRQMLLPLLTMADEDIYIISNMNTVAVGAFSRYRDLVNHPEKRAEVYAIINQAAIWQRDHTDFRYKTLNDENKDKMFGAYMNTDGFGLFDENGRRVWHNLSSSNAAIQSFFGPIAKWYGNNGTAAYANGSETHFVAYLMLDKGGSSTYTHEMVHNLDSNTFFYGFGRRTGQGPELYARGFLQNVSNTEDNIIGLNTLYTELDKKDSLIRVHPYNPVERFNSQEDLNTYAHHMFDAIYMLDYLEGSVVLQQDAAVKKAWFRKIENYYDGVHAGNQIRPLTDEEVAKLVTFDDLIDQSIMNRRQYSDNEKLARNGYYYTFLLSPIYSALDNPTGAPGDLMFRRMAYELLAAKGYDEGFVPYVSNQSKSQAANGIVNDTLVLQHVFNNQYTSWTDFKKDMYKDRIDQLTKLKPITIVYELDKPNSTNTVTINSYQDLENLMKAAVEEDMKRLDRATSNVNTSWVHSLKRKVYSELLRSTDEFRTSIFNP
ncbi:G5 domain-containing protein [Streptococcus suis]|uniref:G5 domain-containing protein n=1 Tax=Streptococcus suis TaxID=1307 RepID=UPI001379DBC2|nr:ZmpA/ZmpB/ZmpC family metallo-endopeptidase [Streptococcus suis]